MNKRQIVVAVGLVIAILTLPVQAVPEKKQTIEQLVQAFAEAYTAKTLASLDAEHTYLTTVKIVVEHSLGEGKNQYEVKQFRTFEKVERWLKSREREEGSPFRQIKPFQRCARGVCTYDFDGGILHNQLYVKKIWYGYRKNGAPYIRKVLLLDGD